MRLGDKLEVLINIITLGQGKRIAKWVAKKFFDLDDCGCEDRKRKLNNITRYAKKEETK